MLITDGTVDVNNEIFNLTIIVQLPTLFYLTKQFFFECQKKFY